MRVLRRREFLLAIPLLALVSLPALPQNLLANPGFDRDLSGWTAATSTFPSSDPGHVEASVAWGPVDSKGSAVSGGAALHARAETFSTASAFVEQCVPAVGGSLVTFGARFLTIRQLTTASGEVQVRFYPSTDCSGTSTGPAALAQLPSGGPLETNSGGRWDLASSSALVPAEARSTRIDVGVSATGTSFYGLSYVDAVADAAFLTAAAATEVVSILPSAAWISGVSAYWRTGMTLVNPGAADAAVALKWLGHDMDGRGGTERAYVVRAGQTLSLSDEEWELNHQQDYGAILMTSSSPSVFLQSETSTPAPSGGSVGQALPALGAADYAGATPKTLAPIRENGAFRTNLVLANPTEIPVMAHVVLFAADGTQLGTQDVALPPLGMTQLTRAAALLGAPALNLGRISVSTPTAGGLVAAYASVIDNVTSDPRTLLPQDATPATPGTNLLTNPGFDRDLSSWTLTLSVPDSNASRSAVWVSDDAAGTSGSGSVALGAGSAGFGGYGWALIEQCASVVPGRTYGLRAKVRGSSWGWFYGSAPWPGLTSSFYESADCTGTAILRQSEGVNAFSSG
ncbi:MAG TPA: hypothetical protein VMV60_06215, partial [Thermoanaerobaculia bacterium]|nr:hypothetical protein [Thermoanaerobaculia bacterium]